MCFSDCPCISASLHSLFPRLLVDPNPLNKKFETVEGEGGRLTNTRKLSHIIMPSVHRVDVASCTRANRPVQVRHVNRRVRCTHHPPLPLLCRWQRAVPSCRMHLSQGKESADGLGRSAAAPSSLSHPARPSFCPSRLAG